MFTENGQLLLIAGILFQRRVKIPFTLGDRKQVILLTNIGFPIGLQR